MSSTLAPVASDVLLSDSDVRAKVESALARLDLDGQRVLLIIPDDTRTCPIGLMLRSIAEFANDRVRALDVMIALGTHRAMSPERIDKHLGLDETSRAQLFPKSRFINHAWDDPEQLATIGTIDSQTMRSLSRGLLSQQIDVTINKALFDYDHLIIVGPTFPHEVVGFSGGNKYFFPGVAGPDIINVFHWLGALLTNRDIIGTKSTPVRDVVDHCSGMIDRPKHCFSMVVSKKGLHGLEFGTPESAYEQAAALSAEVNIRWMPRAYHTVVSVCPPMYPELWTAGKCMYKLEPVVESGGTLIIYAPHLSEVSRTHGHWIEEVGYHVLPYFTAQLERFSHVPLGVLAHSTHVKGGGRYENGVETPNVNVVLASAIPEAMCRQINLGYLDPSTVDLDSYRGRENEGVLVVDRAGEVLHRLESERS